MNRREFCLATGLLLAGSVCGGAVPRSVLPTRSFRARKVFLESWDAEIVRKDSCRAVSFVRERLGAMRREDCDGLLLIPGRCGVSGWAPLVDMEAARLGLTVLVPARLSSALFRKVRAVVPSADEDATAFFLLDGLGNLFGVVLYDKSRCRWTGFASSTTDGTGDSECPEADSSLIAARWIDRARHQLLKGAPQKHG